MFKPAVYILCLATSVGCAGLLLRSYFSSRARLLLWTALCFVFIALNNLFVVVDLVILPDIDFLPLRRLTSLSAVGVLLIGFIWESE